MKLENILQAIRILSGTPTPLPQNGQEYKEVVLNRLNTQVHLVRKQTNKTVNKQFVDDIKREVELRTGIETFDDAYLALTNQFEQAELFVKDASYARDNYCHTSFLQLIPLHQHFIQNDSIMPFVSAARIAQTARSSKSEINTILVTTLVAPIDHRTTVYEALANHEELHALRARVHKESDATFARFIYRSAGVKTPAGIPLSDIVTVIPTAQQFDNNAKYFVVHPRMLKGEDYGDRLAALATTYPLAYIIAQKHREHKGKKKTQEHILAIGERNLPYDALHREFERVNARPTVKITKTYTPREKEKIEADETKFNVDNEPSTDTPPPIEKRVTVREILLWGSEVHRRAMSRFTEKSTIPIRAYDWSGSADSVIESIQPGIIVIAYGNHSSTTTVNRVRDECKLKGAYFLKTHLQNPNRILDEVQKHVLFETA